MVCECDQHVAVHICAHDIEPHVDPVCIVMKLEAVGRSGQSGISVPIKKPIVLIAGKPLTSQCACQGFRTFSHIGGQHLIGNAETEICNDAIAVFYGGEEKDTCLYG